MHTGIHTYSHINPLALTSNTPTAVSTPSGQINTLLLLLTQSNQHSLEKWLIPELVQGKYKVIFEHAAMSKLRP